MVTRPTHSSMTATQIMPVHQGRPLRGRQGEPGRQVGTARKGDAGPQRQAGTAPRRGRKQAWHAGQAAGRRGGQPGRRQQIAPDAPHVALGGEEARVVSKLQGAVAGLEGGLLGWRGAAGSGIPGPATGSPVHSAATSPQWQARRGLACHAKSTTDAYTNEQRKRMRRMGMASRRCGLRHHCGSGAAGKQQCSSRRQSEAQTLQRWRDAWKRHVTGAALPPACSRGLPWGALRRSCAAARRGSCAAAAPPALRP